MRAASPRNQTCSPPSGATPAAVPAIADPITRMIVGQTISLPVRPQLHHNLLVAAQEPSG
jgi:hypothetical protein